MPKDLEKHENTRLAKNIAAPGRPGDKPTWSSGAKTAVGTALSIPSRMWFTVGSGIVNEIYFPDIDCANLRGLKFLVAGDKFFSDQEVDATHSTRWIERGVPGVVVESVCKRGRYRIHCEIIADPARDVLHLLVRFTATGQEDLRLFLYANPHVCDQGAGNEAWVGQYKGLGVLFGRRAGLCIAAACSEGFAALSCGYRGKSDGLADLRKHGRLTKTYTQAKDGNVAWVGEIDWKRSGGEFRVVIAGGGDPAEAALQARMALLEPYEETRRKFVEPWQQEQQKFDGINGLAAYGENYHTSFSVIRTHESKRFPGGFVASLSIPWGCARGDKDTGGYHVLWPRDLSATALALLAAGDVESAKRAIHYLRGVQEADGSMSQNMWLNGVQHWTSTQMDGVAFPALLADALRREARLQAAEFWQMVKGTASFLVKVGPYTKEDRWESNEGYTPYTMSVQVAALLAAADFAEAVEERSIAEFLRLTADAWNEEIDELTYVSGTALAKKHKVSGYYVRIMPCNGLTAESLLDVQTMLVNHRRDRRTHQAVNVVSPDALALVRFGLRDANDPRMLNTVKVIDGVLKTETRSGPVWHRYTDDGYGEHRDGAPFKKLGVGRGWPLLAGERAHYEIARGNFDGAEELRRVMERQTSECGLIPEQIWDAKDIPRKSLVNGRPTGSGMPLVWAHSEYISLLRSLKGRGIWNVPPQTHRRYVIEKRPAAYQIWTKSQQRVRVQAGRDLRVDSEAPGTVEWSMDGWKTRREVELANSGLGVYFAVLPLAGLVSGTWVEFRVDGVNAKVRIAMPRSKQA